MTAEEFAIYKQILEQNEGFVEINLRILDAICPQQMEYVEVDAEQMH